MEDIRRLFFAAEVEAPWPKDYPPARMIPEETRHITLAFLGETAFPKIKELLGSIPLPSFRIGPVGVGSKLVFLPPEKKHVAALSVAWADGEGKLESYQEKLADWLYKHGYPKDKRPFFSHVTIARAPLDPIDWQEHFYSLPLFIKAIRLYQTVECLQYKTLWESPLLSPFEELEHTADIAFLVRGATPQELHRHAQIALAFKHPSLINFFSTHMQNTVEEIVIALNEMIGKADAEDGCPFKAVSFHGNIYEDANHLLNWEMIVDV